MALLRPYQPSEMSKVQRCLCSPVNLTRQYSHSLFLPSDTREYCRQYLQNRGTSKMLPSSPFVFLLSVAHLLPATASLSPTYTQANSTLSTTSTPKRVQWAVQLHHAQTSNDASNDEAARFADSTPLRSSAK